MLAALSSTDLHRDDGADLKPQHRQVNWMENLWLPFPGSQRKRPDSDVSVVVVVGDNGAVL